VLFLSPFRRRALAPHDIRTALAIQNASPEAAQWTAADYAHVDQNATQAWVAEMVEPRGEIAAFLVVRRVADEMEILNLAVHPDHRRRGGGADLLAGVLARAGESGVKKVFLEVRESNAAAISFYKRFHFNIVGRRPKYYAKPDEDALILTLVFDAAARSSLRKFVCAELLARTTNCDKG
jgi:ribosomal-protein-alanine N-acetyltransferase